MEKAVEFSNIPHFREEVDRMPNFTLHELAHAYHDRFLSFDQPDILRQFQIARDNRSYQVVERRLGGNRPNTREKAYAMTDHKEYFAEVTEAFFSENDFFPFRRDQLEKHDPGVVEVLKKVWK
jgi:dipeptidyl-peptidase-4